MFFSSSIFLFSFLPILLLLYFIVPGKCKNGVLLLASLFFYSWGEPKYVFLMLLSIVINYLFGIGIDKYTGKKKILLLFSLCYNIGILFVFKYLSPILLAVNEHINFNSEIKEISLPIGISFFTFQIMSYVIDLYKGKVKVQKNIFNLALYIALFPQLIAGPIVRYSDIDEQLQKRIISTEKIYQGVIRFSVGFSKKVIVADRLAPFVNTAFAMNRPSVVTGWVGMIAYTLQIYYDFSGYSDMALGLGKMFGFDFPENFNYPYVAKSVKDFWRRWHISLGSFFRDYVYIPLGGNRKGLLRTSINIFIVFLLTGVWHGAGLNFLIWGIIYAVFLICERLGLSKLLDKMPSAVGRIYTLLVVMFAWVVFRADNVTQALLYIRQMFVLAGYDWAKFNFVMNGQYYFTLLVGLVFVLPYTKVRNKINSSKELTHIRDICIMCIFVFAIISLVGTGHSPFLYFRF